MTNTNNENVKNVASIDELSELHLEKMRYNNNSLSYILGLLGIVLSIAACFIGLNSLNPNGFHTILKVLLNILVLLIGFLASEKVKVYNMKFTYVMYTLAGVSLARIFWYPLSLIVNYSKYIKLLDINGDPAKLAERFGNAGKSEAGQMLGSTLIGKLSEDKTSIVKTGYMTMDGRVRGIILMVILGAACACFLISGIINHIKSTKLHNYLERINQKK